MDLRQEKVTVRDKEYTFQEMPSRAFLKMQNRTQDKFGNPILEKLYEEILKHIVVEPKVTIDDVKTKELEEVAAEAMRFQLEE